MDGALAQAASVALDGPVLDLVVRGHRAAAALGSGGAAVVDLDSLAVTRFQPLGAIIGADVSGDALAATAQSGVYLYDLHRGRVAGFAPALRMGQQARFADGGVLVVSE